MSIDVDIADLRDARARFLDLVRELRPELHRYCARMTGSVFDGEDVLQDTLVHAYFALAELHELPALRPWLFRIAHNRAIDFLRRYDRRMREPRDLEREHADEPSPPAVLDEQVAVRAALASFCELPPSQRACVILKDVLGYSSREIGEILDLGVSAVDACLHRARIRLRAIARHGAGSVQAVPASSPLVERYAVLFQARDWDGVRALLAEDVELDLVGHSRRRGSAVGKYFTNYGGLAPYRVEAGWLHDQEGIYVFDHPDAVTPAYFVVLVARGGSIAAIRDYRFVPYLLATRT
jgi:RNA polymerase sigma factor (sigma-70 family)